MWGGGHRSRQKLEAIGHVAHTGSKKIQALVCSWLSLLFFCPGFQSTDRCHPYLEWLFPPVFTYSRNPLMVNGHRFVS